MSTLSQESAEKILSSKRVITSPGKYTVKVTSVTEFIKDQTVAIVNFDVMNAFQQGQAEELYAAGDFQGACNQGLSMSLRALDYTPSPTERVDIEVEEITLKSGEKALMAQAIIPRKAVALKKSVWSFSSAPVEAEAEEGEV